MKLCNHRYPRNAKGTCSLRCCELSDPPLWVSGSAHVFAKEGEMPTKRMWGTFLCNDKMSKVCPYRVHTPREKSKPAVWVQCPYCDGRHRTEQGVATCKVYSEWYKAMKEAIAASMVPYDEDGSREEAFPDDVLKFEGFDNTHARLWPWLQEAIRKRDKDTCQDCGAKRGAKDANGSELLFEVHHIIPRGLGGSDHPANLKLVCYECHKRYNRQFNPIIKRKMANERKANKLKVSPLDRF